MRGTLPAAFWALTAVIVVWNLQLAGRIAQNRRAPRPLAALSGLAGLLVLPAALAAAAAPSIFVGRAVQAIAWLWPVVAGLFVVQALYAVLRRWVTPAVGIPFLLYNGVVLAAAIARWRTLGGGADAEWLLALGTAQTSALGVVQGETALWSPYAITLPLLTPVTPARWQLSAVARAAFAVYAAAWAGLVLVVEYPRAVRGVRAFASFGEARLQERPAGDLAVGLRLFPTLKRPPTELMLQNDVALADQLDVGVVSITLAPAATQLGVLDSLARLLADVRRDTTLLVVALDYPDDAAAQYRASPERYTAARVRELRRVVRRLRPDVVIPAIEPYGAGARALGVLPLEAWQRHLTAAAAAVEEDRPRTLVGVSTATFGPRDSALYAWAAARGSPIELVGLTIAPSFDGGLSLAARLGAADRWLGATDARRAPKPHWIFHAVAYPLAHGEASQRDALWGTLAWATVHPQVRGIVFGDAADYGRVTGLRVTGGRLRPAVPYLTQGIELLRETVQ